MAGNQQQPNLFDFVVDLARTWLDMTESTAENAKESSPDASAIDFLTRVIKFAHDLGIYASVQTDYASTLFSKHSAKALRRLLTHSSDRAAIRTLIPDVQQSPKPDPADQDHTTLESEMATFIEQKRRRIDLNNCSEFLDKDKSEGAARTTPPNPDAKRIKVDVVVNSDATLQLSNASQQPQQQPDEDNALAKHQAVPQKLFAIFEARLAAVEKQLGIEQQRPVQSDGPQEAWLRLQAAEAGVMKRELHTTNQLHQMPPSDTLAQQKREPPAPAAPVSAIIRAAATDRESDYATQTEQHAIEDRIMKLRNKFCS